MRWRIKPRVIRAASHLICKTTWVRSAIWFSHLVSKSLTMTRHTCLWLLRVTKTTKRTISCWLDRRESDMRQAQICSPTKSHNRWVETRFLISMVSRDSRLASNPSLVRYRGKVSRSKIRKMWAWSWMWRFRTSLMSGNWKMIPMITRISCMSSLTRELRLITTAMKTSKNCWVQQQR